MLQVPTASVVAEGGVALNHCRWHGSGSSIAVGDDVGRIHIYDVAEVLLMLFLCYRSVNKLTQNDFLNSIT